MKLGKVTEMLYEMLWFANEKSNRLSEKISSSMNSKGENKFFVEVEGKFYKITVEKEEL